MSLFPLRADEITVEMLGLPEWVSMGAGLSWLGRPREMDSLLRMSGLVGSNLELEIEGAVVA